MWISHVGGVACFNRRSDVLLESKVQSRRAQHSPEVKGLRASHAFRIATQSYPCREATRRKSILSLVWFIASIEIVIGYKQGLWRRYKRAQVRVTTGLRARNITCVSAASQDLQVSAENEIQKGRRTSLPRSFSLPCGIRKANSPTYIHFNHRHIYNCRTRIPKHNGRPLQSAASAPAPAPATTPENRSGVLLETARRTRVPRPVVLEPVDARGRRIQDGGDVDDGWQSAAVR